MRGVAYKLVAVEMDRRAGPGSDEHVVAHAQLSGLAAHAKACTLPDPVPDGYRVERWDRGSDWRGVVMRLAKSSD